MNIKTEAQVFPSYRAIQNQVQQEYIQKYQKKLNNLKTHLRKLEADNNFSRDHEEIQASIMKLAA